MVTYQVRYAGAGGQEGRSQEYPNVFLAILKAQNLAVEWQMVTYIWSDGVNCATVYPDGRLVVTL